jgi:hypothetical protein
MILSNSNFKKILQINVGKLTMSNDDDKMRVIYKRETYVIAEVDALIRALLKPFVIYTADGEMVKIRYEDLQEITNIICDAVDLAANKVNKIIIDIENNNYYDKSPPIIPEFGEEADKIGLE